MWIVPLTRTPYHHIRSQERVYEPKAESGGSTETAEARKRQAPEPAFFRDSTKFDWISFSPFFASEYRGGRKNLKVLHTAVYTLGWNIIFVSKTNPQTPGYYLQIVRLEYPISGLYTC